MTASAEDNADMEMISDVLARLGEHFDSVQIFASRQEVDGGDQSVVNIYSGCGNWFARYGQVKNWLITENERTKTRVRNEIFDEEDEE